MTIQRTRPLLDFPETARRDISVVLTDIDDTLTHQGNLPASAYSALERLKQAGLTVVPVTGRPAGWCDMIARLWPVDGVVGENGAFYFRYIPGQRRMVRRYALGEADRRANSGRLATIRDLVLSEVQGCKVSADQQYREADLAIDFAEDVDHLPDEAIAQIVSLFEAQGAQAKVSSIHVNGWFGDYDKLGMTRTLLHREFGIDVDCPTDNARVVFVGDSPNDEPMFRFFKHSVGVANFVEFVDRVSSPPRWITSKPGGFGFGEVADSLLSVSR